MRKALKKKKKKNLYIFEFFESIEFMLSSVCRECIRTDLLCKWCLQVLSVFGHRYCQGVVRVEGSNGSTDLSASCELRVQGWVLICGHQCEACRDWAVSFEYSTFELRLRQFRVLYFRVLTPLRALQANSSSLGQLDLSSTTSVVDISRLSRALQGNPSTQPVSTCPIHWVDLLSLSHPFSRLIRPL